MKRPMTLVLRVTQLPKGFCGCEKCWGYINEEHDTSVDNGDNMKAHRTEGPAAIMFHNNGQVSSWWNDGECTRSKTINFAY